MIYLSGKITGQEDYLSIFRYHENRIKKLLPGEKVINPAEALAIDGLSHPQYMELCMVLLSFCDTVYMIPGWNDSKGAKTELEEAIDKGKRVMWGQRP